MQDRERVVAGLRCRDVLSDLSAYIDGELPPDRIAAINEHLRGCDWCDRFGGDFTRTIEALRAAGRDTDP